MKMKSNNFGRYIAVSAAFLMLTGCGEKPYDGFTLPDDPDPVIDELIGSDYELITHDMCGVDLIYDELVKGLGRTETTIKFSGEVEFPDVDTAVNKAVFTNPEFFWVSGYDVTTNRRSTEIKVWVLNDLSEDDIISMRSVMDAAADSIIAQIPPYFDDFEKVVFVHDYIVEHTDYDSEGALTDKTGFYGTAYGCLVQGKAICQGYALAFKYLMDKLGIPCGMAKGIAGSESHAWNYVMLNGCNYWVDTTWDDPSYGETETGSISHAYCLIDDDMLYRSRTADTDYGDIPTCFSMADNYFVRRGAYFYFYDSAEVISAIESRADERNAELMFADVTELDAAVEGLIKNGDLWRNSDLLSYSDSVHYYVDDKMGILTIIY